MRSPVIESLMVRGPQVALNHVIHDMETRTLVMELRRRAIKRWVPCDNMDRRNTYTIAVQSAFSIRPHNTIQYNIKAMNII